MQEILIYGGVVVNVIGAIILMAFGVKYAYAFHKNKNAPIETSALKSEWAKKRTIGYGLMISGALVAIIGCLL